MNTELSREQIKKALQCLVDNGISKDESPVVLQALCFILINREIEDLLTQEDYEPDDAQCESDATKVDTKGAHNAVTPELKLNRLISFAKESIKDLLPYIYGGEERRNDLMDCGYADGSYDTLISVLDNLGVKHGYEKVEP